MTVDLKKLFASEDITNSKMQTALISALSKNSGEDFDYLKFKVSVKKMLDMGMDKETALKSAFATASVMGVTKSNLIISAKKYKASLDKEREQFAIALKNKIAKNVDGKKVEAERLKKEIISHKEKIAKLLKEIDLFENKIGQVDNVVAEAQEKIESTRNDFKSTFDAIYSQIEEDIINIDSAL
jgi:chromosome segregation ATPase